MKLPIFAPQTLSLPAGRCRGIRTRDGVRVGQGPDQTNRERAQPHKTSGLNARPAARDGKKNKRRAGAIQGLNAARRRDPSAALTQAGRSSYPAGSAHALPRNPHGQTISRSLLLLVAGAPSSCFGQAGAPSGARRPHTISRASALLELHALAILTSAGAGDSSSARSAGGPGTLRRLWMVYLLDRSSSWNAGRGLAHIPASFLTQAAHAGGCRAQVHSEQGEPPHTVVQTPPPTSTS